MDKVQHRSHSESYTPSSESIRFYGSFLLSKGSEIGNGKHLGSFRLPSSGIWRDAAIVRTDAAEESSTFASAGNNQRAMKNLSNI
jgi:hypothetical protein